MNYHIQITCDIAATVHFEVALSSNVELLSPFCQQNSRKSYRYFASINRLFRQLWGKI